VKRALDEICNRERLAVPVGMTINGLPSFVRTNQRQIGRLRFGTGAGACALVVLVRYIVFDFVHV